MMVSHSYSASSVLQSVTVTLGILDFVTKVSIIDIQCMLNTTHCVIIKGYLVMLFKYEKLYMKYKLIF